MKIYCVLDGEGHGKPAHDASDAVKEYINGELSKFTDDMSIEDVETKLEKYC